MQGDYGPSRAGDNPKRWDTSFISTHSLVTLGKAEVGVNEGIWIKAL